MSQPTAKSASTAVPGGNGASLQPMEAAPSLDHLITDDGQPVDNFFVEKQQRLLTEPVNCSWEGPADGKPFVAASNVGLFFEPKNPGFCPDVMLSVGVRLGENLKLKPNRSYFVWLLGKVPDVAIEIVSDLLGGEQGYKMQEYARQGIPYYVIFDPAEYYKSGVLRVFGLQKGIYEPLQNAWFDSVGLGVCLWTGIYEATADEWLRWCDRDGRVIPTGKEKIEQEAQRAEQEKQRAEQEAQRAEKLRAQLRALGIDPSA